MTKFMQNDWNSIKALYDLWRDNILAEEACEWGMPAYTWDEKPMIFMTPIEAWLWADIRNCNAIFYPQYPVGRFFVDFANPVAKVALECDGAEFHNAAKDASRDIELRDMGWEVYRFPGWMCATEPDEETGEPGLAESRLREIVELHRLSRNHRTRRPENIGWGRFAERA
jgi:hypothetical protein